MVDLKDPQVRHGIAVREGIQPRAKQAVLTDAGTVGGSQLILRVAAAGDEERSQRGGVRTPAFVWCPPDLLGVLRSEDRNGQRVVKDERRIHHLVRRASQGHAQGGSGWIRLVHTGKSRTAGGLLRRRRAGGPPSELPP